MGEPFAAKPLAPGALLLATGATGHTGSKLVHRLMADGFAVRAFTRSREKAQIILGADFGGEIVGGDLEREETICSALKGCDALVSVSHVRHAPRLVAACSRTGVRRAVFTSSTRRYTRFPDDAAEAVREGEAAIRESGLDFTILRPTMIFGDDRDENLTKLIRLMRRLPFFPMPGGGRNLVQPTFVHDLVDAIVRALTNDKAVGKEYDIGGPEPMAYRDMLRTIAQAMGKRLPIVPLPIAPALLLIGICEKIARHPIVIRGQILRLKEDKAVDITRARRELGYAPTPFDEAIARKIKGQV